MPVISDDKVIAENEQRKILIQLLNKGKIFIFQQRKQNSQLLINRDKSHNLLSIKIIDNKWKTEYRASPQNCP